MNFLNFLKFLDFFKFFEFFEFFEFKSEPAESTIMKLKSKILTISIIISITNFDQWINQLNDQSINQTFDSSIDQSIKITSAKFIYTLKNFIKQNSIKKRKLNDINKILLFTFNLNKQKINVKLQKIKTAMLKTYAMIENFHILLIVNQINQFFDENMKIVKIDTNIELLTMQNKLNMIIKNQFKLITKFETTKTAQNSKKSQTINLQTINFIKSLQIKSSNHETFKSIEIFSNFNLIKSSIIFMVSIITAKHAITNSKSWTQVVNRETVKKIQKINMIDMIKKVKIDEKTAWKNRRMIMISTTSINQINCMKYRNKMNNVFKKINIHDVLIIAAEMFKIKHFIIFTMIEKNIANQLIKNGIAWKKNFRFSIIHIDETWRKFLIHEIETIIFDNLIDIKLFQNEIEIFNQNVKLIRKFQWLIKSKNRQKKFIRLSK